MAETNMDFTFFDGKENGNLTATMQYVDPAAVGIFEQIKAKALEVSDDRAYVDIVKADVDSIGIDVTNNASLTAEHVTITGRHKAYVEQAQVDVANDVALAKEAADGSVALAIMTAGDRTSVTADRLAVDHSVDLVEQAVVVSTSHQQEVSQLHQEVVQFHTEVGSDALASTQAATAVALDRAVVNSLTNQTVAASGIASESALTATQQAGLASDAQSIATTKALQTGDDRFHTQLDRQAVYDMYGAVNSKHTLVSGLTETVIDSTESVAQMTDTVATDKQIVINAKNVTVAAKETAILKASVATEQAGTAVSAASTAVDATAAAEAWAEGTEPGGPDTDSAKGWAQSVPLHLSEVVGAIGTLHSAVGQVYGALPSFKEEIQGQVDGLEQSIIPPVAVFEALATIGQLAKQINGGQIALTGGNLADPALKIGPVGIYSSAQNTLSVAIGGSEIARLTSSGLTVYGTVTESL